MIKHYRNVFDPTGWVAMFLEWGALWLIAADDKVPSLLSASPRCVPDVSQILFGVAFSIREGQFQCNASAKCAAKRAMLELPVAKLGCWVGSSGLSYPSAGALPAYLLA